VIVTFHHLHCDRCSALLELPGPEPMAALIEHAEELGWAVAPEDLEAFDVCPPCIAAIGDEAEAVSAP
jgi:Fe2+ or Zn2+ uptake regulation protein